MLSRALVPALLCVALCGAMAADNAPPYLIEDPMQIAPPKEPLAKPDGSPPIRALVITPWGATRPVYQIAQHMNMTVDLIPVASRKLINFVADTAARVDQPELVHTDQLLLPASKKSYDVFIVGPFNFGKLPGEVQYNIMQQVAGGAGLALFNQDPSTMSDLAAVLETKSLGKGAEVLRGVPWRMFRRSSSKIITRYPGVRYYGDATVFELSVFSTPTIDKAIGRYKFARGRVAVSNYSTKAADILPQIHMPLDKLLQHRYVLSALAKQVRWAARGNPSVTVWNVLPSSAKVPRGPKLRESGRVLLRGRPGPVELRVKVRNWTGEVEHAARLKTSLKKSEETIPIPLPPLADDEHFLEVQVLRDGNVVDWGASHFTISSPIRIGKIDLDVGEDRALRGDPEIRGMVSLDGVDAPMQLEVRVRDTYDRIEAFGRFPIKAGQAEQRFALRLLDKQGVMFFVEAELRRDDGPVSFRREELTIPKQLNPDRFLAIGWNGPRQNVPSIEKYQLLRRYGYEAALDDLRTEQYARAAAWCDMINVPYMIHLKSCSASHCYTTEKWRTEIAAGLEAQARMVSKYGAVGYSLGDEVRLERYTCKEPTCVKLFQGWLQATYKTTKAMNAEWGSAFNAFGEVVPKYLGDQKKAGNYVPLLDYEQHRRDLWVETCKMCYDAIRRGDPTARVGYEGSSGYQRWPELLEFFRLSGPYTSYDMDTVRDLATRDTVLGNWMGSYKGVGRGVDRDVEARWMTWERLTFQFNSQWWWTTRFIFKGDHTPVRRMAVNAETLALVQGGLGRLLIGSDLPRDAIVIPYSPPSDIIAWYYPELTTMKATKQWTREIIWEQGFRHRRVPTRQIADGALERLGVKVVMLSFHQAFSKSEAQALHRFVENGGTLIADVRPGALNEHGRPLDEGYLDATFGIRRKKIETPHALAGKPDWQNGAGAFAALKGWDAELRADKSVEARPNATVHGTIKRAPICIENRVGKGRAVLLNFALDQWAALRPSGGHLPLQAVYGKLFKESGIKPEVAVTAQGRPVTMLDAPRWRKGDMLIIALDRAPVDPPNDTPQAVTIRWQKPGHVYEILSESYLGETDIVRTELAPHVLKFYAHLPYRIGELKVGVPGEVRAGDRLGVTLELDIPPGAKGRHVVGVDIYRPDGTWVHYLRRSGALIDGKGLMQFGLAHNAPAGEWRLRAREITSGATVERTFRVTPSEFTTKGGK